jgi:hypothetical protein
VAAIGLSAFLLFTLELLAGRLVLPVFGGTPGVWATTLSFFTAVLFFGYVYAHTVAGRLDPGGAGSCTSAWRPSSSSPRSSGPATSRRFADPRSPRP